MKLELTKDEIETARAKYEAGGSLSTICAGTASMRRAMRQVLVANGVTLRPGGRGRPTALSGAQVGQLIKMRKQGVSFVDLAELFDVSRPTAELTYLRGSLALAQGESTLA